MYNTWNTWKVLSIYINIGPSNDYPHFSFKNDDMSPVSM